MQNGCIVYAIKQFPCMVLFWLEARGSTKYPDFRKVGCQGEGHLYSTEVPWHLHFASSLFELMPYGRGQITDRENVTHGCVDSLLLVNQPSIPYCFHT